MGALNRSLSMHLTRGMAPAEQQQMEGRLNAATNVCKGGTLVKFVIGRRRRHERFFHVEGTGMECRLVWSGNAHRIVRAAALPGPGLQHEQRLSNDELSRCFQLLLDGKIVALMAGSRQEKQMWVDGINTVTGVQGDGPMSLSGKTYGRGSSTEPAGDFYLS